MWMPRERHLNSSYSTCSVKRNIARFCPMNHDWEPFFDKSIYNVFILAVHTYSLKSNMLYSKIKLSVESLMKRLNLILLPFLSSLILFSTFLFSCTLNYEKPHRRNTGTLNSHHPELRVKLDGAFYYALCPEGEDHSWGEYSQVEDALQLTYTHLDRMCYRNLSDVAGSDGKYLWLKAEFNLPQGLRNQDLSMIIPYLHFADEVYLNGHFIDSYGFMDKELYQDASYAAHLFDFPQEYLMQQGKNTVLIKVYAMGFATISPGVFIGQRDDCWAASDIASFWQSRIYIFFTGIMMAVCFLFFVLFLFYRKKRIYLYFSLLNLFSILFFSNLFSDALPFVGFHGGISFVTYLKLTCCLGFVGMTNMSALFIFNFLKQKHHKIEILFRVASILFCVISVLTAKSYYALYKLFPYPFLLCAFDLVLSLGMIVKYLFDKTDEEKQKNAFFLFIGCVPLVSMLLVDLIVKGLLCNINTPFFSMFGWQITIIFFFIFFSVRYRRTSIQLEYLNTKLEKEVAHQTEKLVLANKKLDDDIKITQQDMRTAALVQQKLFHPPLTEFPHWDIAVLYKPLSVVSGDFYNFYSMGDELYGVSLFDASGHGVTASLITMLAENIIRQIIRESNIYGEDISITLERINSNFIAAKGNIENYLTGILMNISEREDYCKVTLVDAAHPYPELYHADEGYAEEILPDVENPSYGPVGMDMMEVHYAPITMTMKKDDVLVLFTDGYLDAVNNEQKGFGRIELEQILEASNGASADEILQKITDALSSRLGTSQHTDDITIIVMKRN